MHNTPWKTRPVVNTIRTMKAGLSKLLDHWLQNIRYQVPTYLKDFSHLIQLLKYQGTLPSGAKLFTADAKSMYTLINTDHETSQVVGWMETYNELIPTYFSTKAMKESLNRVMHNNIFDFGDCLFE